MTTENRRTKLQQILDAISWNDPAAPGAQEEIYRAAMMIKAENAARFRPFHRAARRGDTIVPGSPAYVVAGDKMIARRGLDPRVAYALGRGLKAASPADVKLRPYRYFRPAAAIQALLNVMIDTWGAAHEALGHGIWTQPAKGGRV